MLRKTRIALATTAFSLITLLFIDLTGTLHKWLSWLAEIQFWPAILALNTAIVTALIVLTLVLGRIYCSVICPLGVMQDIVSWIHSRRHKNRFAFSAERPWLRHGFLAVFLAAFALGAGSLVALLSPYSSYGRMAENILLPIWSAGNNVLADVAAHYNSYAVHTTDVWIKSVPTFAIATVSAVVIGWMAWRGGRTYCNTVCPVGTILGFMSRWSLMKINIDTDKCNSCGQCGRNCKASCIDTKKHSIDYSRCVVCGDCIDKCRQKAITYSFSRKNGNRTLQHDCSQEYHEKPENTTRRSFLLGTATAATAATMAQQKKKVDGGLAKIENKVAPERTTPLTPPGSLSAMNMARHCTACQLCVAQCPNGVLRPSTNLLTMMQPVMSYERGFCRPECTRCSDVCPTDAIRPITREVKSSTQVGHAVWIRKNCVPLTDGVECGNCARHCPTGAITMISSDPANSHAPKIPAVNTSRCIGCGACENLCPARPFSAIYVEGHEVHKTI